jgi:large subunit ribosomal protein L22
MSKPKREQRRETMDGRAIVSQAHARNLRVAPRKARLVADLIRNKTVGEALEILTFTHRPSAVPYVMNALKSAAANAQNIHPEPENLVVAEIWVDSAAMMKRIRPASMGRAVRVRKRTSHLYLALSEN